MRLLKPPSAVHFLDKQLCQKSSGRCIFVVPLVPVAHHGVARDQQLPHARHQRHLFRLPPVEQPIVERPDRRVPPHRRERRHRRWDITVARRPYARPTAPHRAPARSIPLSRLSGATPTSAAISRRFSRPSSDSSARRVVASTRPTPGMPRRRSRGRLPSSFARHAGLVRIAASRLSSTAASSCSSHRTCLAKLALTADEALGARFSSTTSMWRSCRRRSKSACKTSVSHRHRPEPTPRCPGAARRRGTPRAPRTGCGLRARRRRPQPPRRRTRLPDGLAQPAERPVLALIRSASGGAPSRSTGSTSASSSAKCGTRWSRQNAPTTSGHGSCPRRRGAPCGGERRVGAPRSDRARAAGGLGTLHAAPAARCSRRDPTGRA